MVKLFKALSSGNGHVDVGAAWLSDKTQTKIYALAKSYGFDTAVQPVEGIGVLQDTSGKVQRVGEDAAPSVSVALSSCKYTIRDADISVSVTP